MWLGCGNPNVCLSSINFIYGLSFDSSDYSVCGFLKCNSQKNPPGYMKLPLGKLEGLPLANAALRTLASKHSRIVSNSFSQFV